MGVGQPDNNHPMVKQRGMKRRNRHFLPAVLAGGAAEHTPDLADQCAAAPERACLVEDCRKSGYSAVVDELAYGVIALAVPVFDQYGRVVAALNTSSHSRKYTKAKLIRERLSMLRQVSRELSADLTSVPGLSLSAQL